MKKILCIIDSLDAGGAETFLMKISRSISVEELQIDFVVSKDGGLYSQEVLERGGKIYVIPPRRKNFFGAFWGIRAIVKNNGYKHVLKLGDLPVEGIDLLAAKLGGARYLGFRSCNALVGLSAKDKIVNFIMRPILNRIANVKLAPSMLAAEFTFGKNARSNVQLLHNGVDLQVFYFDVEGRKRIRESFSLNNKFVVGHIGRFHRQKNHRYLLEVFHAIRQQRQDAVLMLVGTGELEESIKTWIAELYLEPYVIFTGVRLDVPQILSAMDVFVFPSLHEGMPNTVIEAQATGLSCVIADTITKEANITELVTYLPLSTPPDDWANMVLSVAETPRCDTSVNFRSHGYDIQSVSGELLTLFDLIDESGNT